jgi:class 3 adenylate cyclase
LYLDPLEKALVLRVDVKSQCQAPGGSQPALPVFNAQTSEGSHLVCQETQVLKLRNANIMSKIYLEWSNEKNQIRRLEIIDKIFIGRTCKGVDGGKRILLKHPLVSRNHAEISRTALHLQITDTSKNGTWVNGVRMAAGSLKALADGDSIRVGETTFRVFGPQGISDGKYDDTSIESTMEASVERVVTNLVADLRGFSAYAQTHVSTDVYGIIKEIFDHFSKIVEDLKGTIKDYAGDAIFAFWEHQSVDPAKHSVLACQAAHQQLQNFNRILMELSGKYSDVLNLQMGWGISTGSVIMATHYGSRVSDLVMVGDCVNLAFRMSGMANREVPENILICCHTAKLVEKKLTVKDLGMLPIRGREGEEHIFALVK